MSDHRPVLFNFFDVVAFGIIFACGAAAIFLVDAKSLLAAVVSFAIGASVPVAGFVLLERVLRKERGQNGDS